MAQTPRFEAKRELVVNAAALLFNERGVKGATFADIGIVFTAGQQARLQAVFADGVCDWTKPGVGQQAPLSPQTYAAGAGGVPLPPAPVSTPI